MKKVTDLKENECIHCATKEEFKSILELNPNNTVEKSVWKYYREETIYYPCDDNKKGSYSSINHAKNYNYTIHPASDFLQPTYQLTKEQILQIAKNCSLVKELFPDVFEEEYTEKGWYYATCHGTEDYLCYFEKPKTLVAKYWFSPSLYFAGCEGTFNKIQRKGNTKEVKTALVNEAKRRGFEGKERLVWKIDGVRYSISNPELSYFEYEKESNILFFAKGIVFDNGTWAEIITTQNDVIKVIETYGKDKLITLIEAYDNRNSK